MWTIVSLSVCLFIVIIKLFEYLHNDVPVGVAMGDGFGDTKRLVTFHMKDRDIPPTDKRRA